MKALRTKVILSGIVLVFAFIATIGTTFAWFTVSQTATVDTLTLNVTSADSLLILAADNDGGTTYLNTGLGEDGGIGAQLDLLTASNYTSFLQLADLEAANYDLSTYLMQPATIIDSGYATFDASTLSSINLADRTLTELTPATDFNSASGYAIQLDFWMYFQGEPLETQIIELNSLSISADGVGTNSATQATVEDAVRLSIWSSTVDFTVDGSNVGAVAPNYSVNTAGTAYVFGNDNDYSYSFNGTANDITNENTLAQLDQGTVSTAAPNAVNIVSGTALTKDIFTLNANTPTLVTVLIYIEGWDLEADNDISLADFNISFGFEYGVLGDSN